MTNEAIDIGAVGSAKQDQKAVVPQNLQPWIKPVDPQKTLYEETKSSLEGTGAAHVSPDAPATITTGEHHEQFAEKPKFNNTAEWGDDLLNQKRREAADFQASKATRPKSFLSRILHNPFNKRKETANATG